MSFKCGFPKLLLNSCVVCKYNTFLSNSQHERIALRLIIIYSNIQFSKLTFSFFQIIFSIDHLKKKKIIFLFIAFNLLIAEMFTYWFTFFFFPKQKFGWSNNNRSDYFMYLTNVRTWIQYSMKFEWTLIVGRSNDNKYINWLYSIFTYNFDELHMIEQRCTLLLFEKKKFNVKSVYGRLFCLS